MRILWSGSGLCVFGARGPGAGNVSISTTRGRMKSGPPGVDMNINRLRRQDRNWDDFFFCLFRKRAGLDEEPNKSLACKARRTSQTGLQCGVMPEHALLQARRKGMTAGTAKILGKKGNFRGPLRA